MRSLYLARDDHHKRTMKNIELLAPVGNINKLNTALHFGADAVYLAGKDFGLRAYAENFYYEEIIQAVTLCHSIGKKVYVTVNIFARNADFGYLNDYLQFLEKAEVDGIIVSDAGIVALALRLVPKLDVHLSTQANTTNKYAVSFWKDIGVKRVVLARELALDDIKEIADVTAGEVELEAFIHGAMCISYSGRCLLSSYLTNRDSNRGECVQACRWEYTITEKSRPNKLLTLEEDERGSYLLNSMDLCAMPFLEKVIDAGVTSLKIEGRMKSEFYVATVTNAYRKRIDAIIAGGAYEESLMDELNKISHRQYTEGFYLNKEAGICYNTSKPDSEYEFVAEVLGYDGERGAIIVEQRNRFFAKDTLEILSPSSHQNTTFQADEIFDEQGERVMDCKLVQQKLWIKSPIRLFEHDILHKRRSHEG